MDLIIDGAWKLLKTIEKLLKTAQAKHVEK